MNPLNRYRLMTPGPTPVPEVTREVLGREVKHHRTEEFRTIFRTCQDKLREIFCTRNEIAILTGSGTAAMEACVVNAVSRGEKALILYSGKFAERWADLCEVFDIQTILYSVPWGESFQPEKVREYLVNNPEIKAVYATLSETSTGVGHNIQEIGRVVADFPALFVVDGISGVGGMECRTDEWHLDLLAVGSQKALMTPPGLSFVAVSEKAWTQINQIKAPCFYLDLKAYRKAAETCDTPYTPPRSLFAALAESLNILCQFGVENMWHRTAVMSAATQAGVRALGLTVFPKHPCEVLTLCLMPDNLDVKMFLKRLERDYGVKIAGAQGELKGRGIRIAHMGMIDPLDVLGCLSAMELVLYQMGYPVTLGSALSAAEKIFAQE